MKGAESRRGRLAPAAGLLGGPKCNRSDRERAFLVRPKGSRRRRRNVTAVEMRIYTAVERPDPKDLSIFVSAPSSRRIGDSNYALQIWS